MFEDVLCIIPARGGSKGIPQKNLQELGGVPLVAHSIRHAQEAGIPFHNIVVSSDDKAILDVASGHGVEAHRRPDNISGDLATTEEAMLDVFRSLGGNSNHTILLQPTSPIRFKGRIKECFEAYVGGNYDSLVATTKFYDLFWQEIQKPNYNRTQYVENLPEPDWEFERRYNRRAMRQKLRRNNYRYFDNGSIYITNVDVLWKTKNRTGENPCIFPISELEGMQIDTPEDLKIFRAIFDGGINELCSGQNSC